MRLTRETQASDNLGEVSSNDFIEFILKEMRSESSEINVDLIHKNIYWLLR